jgi:hypothetical protein
MDIINKQLELDMQNNVYTKKVVGPYDSDPFLTTEQGGCGAKI